MISFHSTVHHFNLFLLLSHLSHRLIHCNLYDLYIRKLTEPGVFPLKLQDSETQWKIAVFYDVGTDQFALTINDIPFPLLPYQAEVLAQGPRNIEGGKIKLN